MCQPALCVASAAAPVFGRSCTMLDRDRTCFKMHMEMFSAAQDHHRYVYHYQSIDRDDRLGWLAQTFRAPHAGSLQPEPSRFGFAYL